MGNSDELTLHVSEKRYASTGQPVVVFDARILLLQGDSTIDVYFVGPYDNSSNYPPPQEVEQLTLLALGFIREAVVNVLTPRNMGALCEVSRLPIQVTDFHAHFYKPYMVKHLEQALLDAGL